MLPTSPATAIGVCFAFFAGFGSHVLFGPAVAPEPDWPWGEPVTEGASSATVSSVTAITEDQCAGFDEARCCPAATEPLTTSAEPESLRVVGSGATATVELPVLALALATVAGQSLLVIKCRGVWRSRATARRVLEPIGEARIHVA